MDTARTQYETLLQRLKEVSFANGIGSSQISIVDPAIKPNRPFSPNSQIYLGIGTLFGAGFGVCLAFLLFLFDNTVKTPEDIKEKLRLPVIGVIPKVKMLEADENVISQLQDPRASLTEAYFSARTTLEYASDTGLPNSILVTSTQPGEGKSSSSLALAYAFAKIGRRVLIIDADMRKPSFVADGDLSVGLSGLLTKNEKLMDNVILSDQHSLSLLPSGVIPPNPAELLSSPKLKDLINEASKLFDLVVVDSPPILNFTDGPVLGSVCDATIIVCKSGKIGFPSIQRTIERLRENRSNILGILLTHFDAKKSQYNYNYYYYAYGKGGAQYGNNNALLDKKQEARKITLFDNPRNDQHEDQ